MHRKKKRYKINLEYNYLIVFLNKKLFGNKKQKL